MQRNKLIGKGSENTSANKKIIFKAIGENVSDEIIIGESENGITIVNETEDQIFQGVYDIKYLCIFTKCTNLCANVEVFTKNDYPLVIRYYVASLGTIYLCLSSKTVINNDYDSDSE